MNEEKAIALTRDVAASLTRVLNMMGVERIVQEVFFALLRKHPGAKLHESDLKSMIDESRSIALVLYESSRVGSEAEVEKIRDLIVDAILGAMGPEKRAQDGFNPFEGKWFAMSDDGPIHAGTYRWRLERTGAYAMLDDTGATIGHKTPEELNAIIGGRVWTQVPEHGPAAVDQGAGLTGSAPPS